jgi:hypothetical protein
MTTPVRPAPTIAPAQRPAPETPTPITLTAAEEFRDWLCGLPPGDVCGWPHIPNACPLASFLNAQNAHAGLLATVGREDYTLAHERYLLPGWAARFVARVDHAPAHWKRPATQGITAAEALRLLEGLDDNGGDGSGRQEAQDGCAGHAPRDDGRHGPHTGTGAVDGGPTVGVPDGALPWLSWPLLTLPGGGARSGACRTGSASL